MSDGYFCLLGVLNGHNIWYWYWENSKSHECVFHSPKVTVWCSVTFSTIIGFHIFENKQTSCSINSNAESYQVMLENFLAPAMGHLCMHMYSSSKKVAMSHTANISMDMLQNNYPGWLISLFGDIFGLHNLWTWWPLIS